MPARARTARLAALVAGALLAASACSTAGGTATPGGTDGTVGPGRTAGGGTTPGNAAGEAAWQRPACTRPVAAVPTATPVPGSTRDLDVTSFDGTTIRAHWFPRAGAGAARPAPTVLMGPGWSLPGDTDEDTVGVLGAMNISSLRDAGFNVLTWDPRGFGASGGTAEVDSKDAEGRDVQVLLDWVAGQPEVQLDAAGDPRAGMIGGSYGGGIQLVTAAIDCRVDAIVPVMAWHSLVTSLYKADTPKLGWSNILTSVTARRPVDPHAQSATASANQHGTISAEDIAWFADRGPGDLVGQIHVPTLIVQGTVDTLFTLDEGITNYRILRDHGVPSAMLWYCGGHGTCLTDGGPPARMDTAALDWLRHWLIDPSVPLGARVDLLDQHGTSYPVDDYPAATGAPITATGSGTLALRAGGGAGPATVPGGEGGDLMRSLVLPITPGRASDALEVGVDPGPTASLLVGAPELRLTYRGTTPAGDKPTRVFAQLVDDATGLVVGNQITPIQVTLDGEAHTTTVPLEVICFATTPGQRLTLQLVATTVAYAEPRLGGSVTFDEVDLSLPTAAGLTPGSPAGGGAAATTIAPPAT